MAAADMTPDSLFEGHPDAWAVYARVRDIVAGMGPWEVRTTKSQVAFRRARGFAYVWRPGQYLASADAPAVLSIALGRHVESPRFKEVAHPSATQWMHHLEVHDPAEVDDEVAAWLREAAERAG
jgi:hypothetical protein